MDYEWDSQVGQFVEGGPRLFEGIGVRTLSEESSGYVGMGGDDSFYGFYGAVLSEFDDLFEEPLSRS